MDGDFHCLDEMLQILRVWIWGKFGGDNKTRNFSSYLVGMEKD
jgi:hypothetical protein